MESAARAIAVHDAGGDESSFRWFHYIPRDREADWVSLGWRVTDKLGDYHGQYSLLGEWMGAGPPVKPSNASLAAL